MKRTSVIIIVVLVIAGGVALLLMIGSARQQDNQPTATTSDQSTVSEWETYTSANLGISFTYAVEWGTVHESPNAITFSNISSSHVPFIKLVPTIIVEEGGIKKFKNAGDLEDPRYGDVSINEIDSLTPEKWLEAESYLKKAKDGEKCTSRIADPEESNVFKGESCVVRQLPDIKTLEAWNGLYRFGEAFRGCTVNKEYIFYPADTKRIDAIFTVIDEDCSAPGHESVYDLQPYKDDTADSRTIKLLKEFDVMVRSIKLQ